MNHNMSRRSSTPYKGPRSPYASSRVFHETVFKEDKMPDGNIEIVMIEAKGMNISQSKIRITSHESK